MMDMTEYEWIWLFDIIYFHTYITYIYIFSIYDIYIYFDALHVLTDLMIIYVYPYVYVCCQLGGYLVTVLHTYRDNMSGFAWFRPAWWTLNICHG